MFKDKKYNLKEAKVNYKWDEFLEKSGNPNPYVSSDFLNSLDLNKKLLFCLKGKEIVAGIVIILSNDNQKIVGNDLIVYDGVFFRNFENLNKSQKYSEKLQILSFIGTELINNFNAISLKLDPIIDDIRGFSWVNHNTDKQKYNCRVKYTSYIDLNEFTEIRDCNNIKAFKNSSVSRRQEIRQALKNKKIETQISHDIEKFMDLYEYNFAKQNIIIDKKLINEMYSLLKNLLNKKKLIITSTSINKEVSYMNVFLVSKKAYYFAGAGDKNFQKNRTGTAALWNSFFFLKNHGFQILDLEGVNSPSRGWYKMSFGGDLISYFNIFTSDTTTLIS